MTFEIPKRRSKRQVDENTTEMPSEWTESLEYETTPSMDGDSGSKEDYMTTEMPSDSTDSSSGEGPVDGSGSNEDYTWGPFDNSTGGESGDDSLITTEALPGLIYSITFNHGNTNL